MKDPYWDYWAQLSWHDPERDTCDGGAPCRHCHGTPVFRLCDVSAGTRERVATICLHCGEGEVNMAWVEDYEEAWRA